MLECTMISFSIEHMKKLFNKNNVRKDGQERLDKIAQVIKSIDPHILGIVEASNKLQHHEAFVNDPEFLNGRYQIVKGEENRGAQDFVGLLQRSFFFNLPL